jgi:eukaryotic-like serine/threonine-protein kinase
MTMRWPPLSPARGGDVIDEARASEPTPSLPIEVGTVVAEKYRVDRVIGFGGMGIVCAGTHLELATPVAIKFMRPERGSDERTVARFLTEARAAAQLQSQYSCRVMDCGRLPSGSPYIVMEYLVGKDLRTLVSERGPLEVEQAVTLSLQACEALAEAHGKHIVHRDVKPENLFIAEGPGGAPLLKVLDFGISKQLSPLMTQRSLTDSSESIGSPLHMSPEQMIDPAGVDSRSDIWSLGVVLYEMLTGQFPFTGATGPQLCANVMTTEPISPQQHRAEIPDGLVRVILRCLQKDRQRRFHDVGELSLALRQFGGAGSALAAARVEQILGRTTPPPANVAEQHDETTDAPSSAGSEPIAGIPGVPPRGLGLRFSVALVLVGVTGLAAYAVRHALAPSKPASETKLQPAPPVAPPAVDTPAPPSSIETIASARPKPKKPRSAVPHEATPAPAPAPAPAVTTELDAPPATSESAIVYPVLKPPPDM